MIFSVSFPNFSTILFANLGPTPLTRPEPRYFSIPYTVAGSVSSNFSTENCRPYLASIFHIPSRDNTEPTWVSGIVPTTVTRSL